MTPMVVEVLIQKDLGGVPAEVAKFYPRYTTFRRDWQMVERPKVGEWIEYPSIRFNMKVEEIIHRVNPDQIVIRGEVAPFYFARKGVSGLSVPEALKSVGFVEVQEEGSDGK